MGSTLLKLCTTATEAAQRYLRARDQTAQLPEALSTRAVIDQAKGSLVAVRRISADEAFDVLVGQSQQQNLKLRDLAARFVTDIVNGDD